MPLILIKNNLKLMLRSKWILFLMIICPVITSALLSNAFKEMMKSAYTIESFKVGYRISEDSKYKDMIPELKTVFKEQGITLQKFPEGGIKKLLQGKAVTIFVDIKKNNSYVVYQSSGKDKEAAVVNSILNSFFYQANGTMTAFTYAKEHGIGNLNSQSNHKVTAQTLKVDPIPDSTDYYGIIYIVYFAWCGMLSLAEVISSERKGAVPRRMRVAHMPKISYYLGKFIPCALAVFIELCCAWALSVLLLGVHWGRPILSALILFVLSLAVSAFGMVLYQLFRKVAFCTIVGFTITWFIGYFGGSFEPYMYLNLPKYLMYSSPIYYIDRTLVEFSTKGCSDYFGKCILFLIGLIIVFGMIGILLMNRKMEEQ